MMMMIDIDRMWRKEWNFFRTLLSEILFDPTNVVFSSLTMPTGAAGDCVGDGRYTSCGPFGLMWFKDNLRFGVPLLRSYNQSFIMIIDIMIITKWWQLTCSWVVVNVLIKCWLLLVTSNTSCCCWNGDCDGDGCKRGLCCIDGDWLGVKKPPEGDKIPAI